MSKGCSTLRATLSAWIASRTLLELIEEAPVVELDADTLVQTLRKLPARLYSITSRQAAVDEEVHLIVAAVRYEAQGRRREGMASTWLADRLKEDETVPVYIGHNKHFRLPERYASKHQAGEGFGDFLVRAGIVNALSTPEAFHTVYSA